MNPNFKLKFSAVVCGVLSSTSAWAGVPTQLSGEVLLNGQMLALSAECSFPEANSDDRIRLGSREFRHLNGDLTNVQGRAANGNAGITVYLPDSEEVISARSFGRGRLAPLVPANLAEITCDNQSDAIVVLNDYIDKTTFANCAKLRISEQSIQNR